MSAQGFTSKHFLNNGKPEGGVTYGTGFTIAWQRGPLKSTDPETGVTTEFPPNGAFVEDIIAAAMDRISLYQTSEFACEENAVALGKLSDAIACLQARTARRESEGVEGTWEV